ncbi:MAG: TIGR00266 family protein [Candidatus Helarchaeota archaeon]|nr:TIGR00266 family protein [Candidatus Helarchaeota archaeon]
MKHKIIGTTMQHLIIELDQDEEMWAETGKFLFSSGNIRMDTKMKGGFWKSIKRKLSGESFFMAKFIAEGSSGTVGFAPSVPGTILARTLGEGEYMIAEKDAYLCSESSVTLEMTFQKKFGSALFGGEGFILQKITGPGTFFIAVAGELIEVDLKAGEILKVDTGSAVMWDSTVEYSIQRVKGVKNIFFGGEGLFLVQLTGPGKAILQSMSLIDLAKSIAPYMPGKQ